MSEERDGTLSTTTNTTNSSSSSNTSTESSNSSSSDTNSSNEQDPAPASSAAGNSDMDNDSNSSTRTSSQSDGGGSSNRSNSDGDGDDSADPPPPTYETALSMPDEEDSDSEDHLPPPPDSLVRSQVEDTSWPSDVVAIGPREGFFLKKPHTGCFRSNKMISNTSRAPRQRERGGGQIWGAGEQGVVRLDNRCVSFSPISMSFPSKSPFGPSPCLVRCRRCRSAVLTEVEAEPGCLATAACCLLAFM